MFGIIKEVSATPYIIF